MEVSSCGGLLVSEKLAFVVRDTGSSSKSELSSRMLLLPEPASVCREGFGKKPH